MHALFETDETELQELCVVMRWMPAITKVRVMTSSVSDRAKVH